jgi:hypothetical protein
MCQWKTVIEASNGSLVVLVPAMYCLHLQAGLSMNTFHHHISIKQYHALAMQVWELNGPELKLVREVEHPVSFKCGTFAASSAQDRHLATGNFKGDTYNAMLYNQSVQLAN